MNMPQKNARALEVEFTAYGEPLEQVGVFKYLGRLLAMDDNDMQAVRHNLRKARGVWPPRVCGMFYKAVVQSVLLYGSETWTLSDSSIKCLEGFNNLSFTSGEFRVVLYLIDSKRLGVSVTLPEFYA